MTVIMNGIFIGKHSALLQFCIFCLRVKGTFNESGADVKSLLMIHSLHRIGFRSFEECLL